jgi:putative NADH-flavin reductase
MKALTRRQWIGVAAVLSMLLPGTVQAKKAEHALKIIVYGSNGALGRSVVTEALARGHAVTAVDSESGPAKPHKNLTVRTGDMTDMGDFAKKAAGHHVLIAVNDRDDAAFYVKAVKTTVIGLRIIGVFAPRLVWVGDAATLKGEDGKPLIETTPRTRQAGRAAGQQAALNYLAKTDDLNWSYLTPPVNVKPGKARGKYRTGGDTLLSAPDKSIIAMGDLASAVLDEAEKPKHNHAQFTVAQ